MGYGARYVNNIVSACGLVGRAVITDVGSRHGARRYVLLRSTGGPLARDLVDINGVQNVI